MNKLYTSNQFVVKTNDFQGATCKLCVTSAMKYCLAIKLTWILFHYICALKDESENPPNGSSVGMKKTTKNLVNSSTHKSNFSTLEYVSTSVNVTPQPNLTTSNVTLSSKEVLNTRLPNPTEQLAKSLSQTTATNTPEPYSQEETGVEIDNPEKPKQKEISPHSGGSHADPEEKREKDFEDNQSPMVHENHVFNRKDFVESESKKSKPFIPHSDMDTVVHDTHYIPDVSISYILVICCILVVFIICIWKPFCHMLYNIYSGCCSRSRISRIDMNSKVAYRHLSTEEF
ncbi:unnamed protein product [Schistosoma turkestanicum]|nr:unnamed protein product [Schistosoma turkestanicum]